MYSISEPNFEELVESVTLVKEILSEQTFLLGISVGDPGLRRPATLETANAVNYDYRLTSSELFFPPFEGSVVFQFFLNHDESPEAEEAFTAAVTPAANLSFPTFQSPITSTVFANTEIRIVDDDST